MGIPTSRALVYTTDAAWYNFLRTEGPVEPYNFWTKDLKAITLQPGEYLIFRSKAKDHWPAGENMAMGCGLFRKKENLSFLEAWERYGRGNGARTAEAFVSRARSAVGIRDPRGEYKIGCLEIERVAFFPFERWVDLAEFGIKGSTIKAYLSGTEATEVLHRAGHPASA